MLVTLTKDFDNFIVYIYKLTRAMRKDLKLGGE